MAAEHRKYALAGFTLVELAIVLVIIGLLVGGILVGQDLIRAATVQAQVNQIAKLDAGVNTFQLKYGGIHGDLEASKAAESGLLSVTPTCSRPPCQGQRNGDG